MFNVGPLELGVLAIVGLIVLGPDRLPQLAKDAARLLRTLRDVATGARTQLRDELGPEFADIDLRSLNPRTAITRAVLGEDTGLNGTTHGAALQRFFDDEQPAPGAVSLDKPDATGPTPRPAANPLGRDERAPFDPDAT